MLANDCAARKRGICGGRVYIPSPLIEVVFKPSSARKGYSALDFLLVRRAILMDEGETAYLEVLFRDHEEERLLCGEAEDMRLVVEIWSDCGGFRIELEASL